MRLPAFIFWWVWVWDATFVCSLVCVVQPRLLQLVKIATKAVRCIVQTSFCEVVILLACSSISVFVGSKHACLCMCVNIYPHNGQRDEATDKFTQRPVHSQLSLMRCNRLWTLCRRKLNFHPGRSIRARFRLSTEKVVAGTYSCT